MKKQRILSALLALCIVFSLVPTALAEKADDFTDVSRSDWYYQFVDYVTSKGYFNGVADKTFAPADNMTRAMFVTVLFRFHGAKGDRSQSAFTDVAPGEWYTDAINWAAANRIVDGVGNGKFAPNDPITRAQMCTMIERYLVLYRKAWKVTLPETGSVSVMVDESAIPAYALAAVKQCQRHGLVNGFEDGTFRPNGQMSRAMFAMVLWRVAGSPASSAALPFADVAADAWYADAVRWAYAAGVINGVSATAFDPESPVTREQMVTMIVRYAEKTGAVTGARDDLSQFSDGMQVSSYALAAVRWAVAVGLLRGMGNGRLEPQGTATRAEVATLLMRFAALRK